MIATLLATLACICGVFAAACLVASYNSKHSAWECALLSAAWFIASGIFAIAATLR